jgi:hypothetical protein
MTIGSGIMLGLGIACVVALALLGRVGRALWPKAEPQKEGDDISVDQKNLEYHKARVLKIWPEATCHYCKVGWPGGEDRWTWWVSKRPLDSMPFATAATEEWAWERAAIDIAFWKMQKALESADPDQCREALEYSRK